MSRSIFIHPKSLSLILMVTMAFTSGSLVHAQEEQVPEEPKPQAFTQIPENDPSFELLGEFVGEVKFNAEEPAEPIGLQLRPISGSDFDAMLYRGGLPGAGHTDTSDDASEQQEDSEETESMFERSLHLVGRRNKDRLVLSGSSVAFFVDPDGCTLIDSRGNRLGRLDRLVRVSPTLDAQPPQGAIVLFDGEQKSNLHAPRITEDGWVCEGFTIKPMIQDFDLHLEFRLPYMPSASGQKRANSGIYIHGRYECQILDSFATEPLFNGLGAIYRTKSPDLNMAFPPLQWQTYDIRFTSARFNSDGSKFSSATLTSWVNGVKVQDNVTIEAPTGHGKPEEPKPLPIYIQNHGDPIRFRNLWMIDRGLMHIEFPVVSAK